MSSVDQPLEGVVSIQQTEKRDEAAGKPASGADQKELRVEELEERIAPKLAANHNESLLIQ